MAKETFNNPTEENYLRTKTDECWILTEEELQNCILKCIASTLCESQSFPVHDRANILQPFSHISKTKRINSRLKTEKFQAASFGNLSLQYLIGRGTFGYAILAQDDEKSEKSYVLKVDNTKEHVEWEICVHKIVSCTILSPKYLIIF